MRKTRILLVTAVVLAMSGFNLVLPSAALAAPPTLASATFIDSDHNGAIDRIKVIFDDVVTSCKFEAGDWVLSGGSLTLTGPTWRLNNDGIDENCNGSSNYFFLQVSGAAGQTGYPATYVPADVQYKNQGTLDDVLASGGTAMATSSIVNIDDTASPVIISSTPSAGSTGISVTTSFVRVTFSEPMNTGATSMSISAGSWGPPSWSDSNKTLTRSRLLNLPYDTSIAVTLIGEDLFGYLVSSGSSPAVSDPWSFRTTTDPALTVSTTQSTVSALPTSVAADGSTISVVTATIKNSSGTPLSGRVVTLTSTRGALDTILSMTPTTGSDGKAYFQIHSNTAGSSIFTAATGSTTITETATVIFTSTVSASRSSVSATPSSVVANGSDYSTVTVTVRDASDVLLSGKVVSLSSSRGSTDTITTLTGTTGASGQATFTVRSSTVGTPIFTATASGTTITQTATVSFTTVTPTVSASRSSVSAIPSSVVANGSNYSTVTVTVRDASDVLLSGKIVSLSSSRGSTDTITTLTGTTGASGQATFTVRSSTVGTPIFTAVASSVVITQTATVGFTAVTSTVSASRSSVSATPSSVIADNSSYATVYVTVRDASDNLLSGKTVVLTSSRGSADTVSSISGGSITNSSGQATLQVRSGTAGTSIFTATVDSTAITQTATVTFTAVTPPSGLVYGDLFKESGSTAVYYLGTDGKRHVFPTQAIYFSWYSGFSSIKTVSHGTVTLAPLGGNVIAKPGTNLIQFVSMDTPFRVLDPKIYALEASGQLRWVTSASAASALYGADWEKKIIAVPEVFRTNYIEGGSNINSASDYSKSSVEASARTISNTIR